MSKRNVYFPPESASVPRGRSPSPSPSNSSRGEGQGPVHPPPRLVIRDLPFFQSRSRVQVQHNQQLKIFSLLRYDWFHVCLRWPTSKSLLALLTVWTGMILFFAGMYVMIDARNLDAGCGLGDPGTPIEFGAAFAFSLETCTTVGYGLPSGTNAFFENCQSLQFVIYLQMVWSMMFNAFLFAFFYNRLAKCDTRGLQVLFSKNALISIDPNSGQIRLQVRIFDVDARHPVVEAHCRLYCVLKDQPVPRPLRLLQPNDELGGMLFLSVPTVVAHHVDAYSLLHPSHVEKRETPYDTAHAGGVILREVDSTSASREEIICPVCAESYGTVKRWQTHVRFQKMVEGKDNYPVKGSHLEIDDKDLIAPAPPGPIDIARVQRYFEKHVAEIVCLVEGIDPLMSGTFQSLQSYQYQDVVFGTSAHFEPCLYVDAKRQIQVNLDGFHGIEKMGSSTRKRKDPWSRSWRHHDAVGPPTSPGDVSEDVVLADDRMKA